MSVDPAELRRLLAEATPGPWGPMDGMIVGSNGGGVWQVNARSPGFEDAALIVFLVNNAEGLLDRLEAAEKVCEAAEYTCMYDRDMRTFTAPHLHVWIALRTEQEADR